MTDYAELEIGLHRRDASSYTVEMRFSHPRSEADIRLARDDRAAVLFDRALLHSLALDPVAYGQALSDSLFASPAVLAVFSQASTAAQDLDLPLRVRLAIGPSAPELHTLRWETLRDPQNGAWLATSERCYLSRYLSSLDWLPVRLRARSRLRALVVVANPANLTDYEPGGQRLTPFDVAAELTRARASLNNMDITPLTERGSVTMHAMSEHLRDGYDILYMVVHGALLRGIAYLWMEDEAGQAAVVPGEELVARLQALQQRPRLVILASCQSAGQGTDAPTERDAAAAALGPRLAEAGIAAVLAMQGDVSIETMSQFMPVFFEELQRDGQIDRAAAIARGAVRNRPDWWMPVLFMRLKSGRIWYVPGFAGEEPDFEKWPALITSIMRKRCTPILGPGLVEALFGTSQEMARRWAETYRFPMQPHAREDLPQVAQFLAVNQSRGHPYDKLEEHLHNELLRGYAHVLPPDADSLSLDALIKLVGKHHRDQKNTEPHSVLARLPFPIYITTNSDDLLANALVDAGKQPYVELCPWNEYIERTFADYDDAPTPERPLVYHLFGRLPLPESLVLTEDDYFDYLIGVTSNKDLIPGVVRRALVSTSLLFLGFRVDDWNFRVLFRSLMSQEGRSVRSRYAHVAVQIDPEEGRILEPERARRYLESYFRDADISIFWGSVNDFVAALLDQYEAREREP